MSNRLILILACAVGLALLAAWIILLAARAMTAAGPPGFGVVFEDCPKCGARVGLSPGREVRCSSCGERLAACLRCGATLRGPEVAGHVNGTNWLCKVHLGEEEWESARLREFGGPDARRPPPDTPRALAARLDYERRVSQTFEEKKDPIEDLFTVDQRRRVGPTREAEWGLPMSVVEAYRFYEKAVMERDNGSVRVFSRDLEGRSIYYVACQTDGSDGFLELYDDDGSVLGYARTQSGCPVWTSRGVTRRRAFVGDPDDVDDKLAEVVKRLGGGHP